MITGWRLEARKSGVVYVRGDWTVLMGRETARPWFVARNLMMLAGRNGVRWFGSKEAAMRAADAAATIPPKLLKPFLR